MVFGNSASWEPGNEHNESANSMPEIARGVPLIKVMGVGGGGSNAVSRMYKDKLPVVEYYALNTDAQHLFRCDVSHRIALGQGITRGLGSGAQPELGRQSAEESRPEIEKAVAGADMVFVAVGMGGGTGSGAAPVVCQIAKESGALTVAVVSRPFSFEAAARRKNADEGIELLKEHADTVIVIPNDRLLELNHEKDQTFTWEDALKMADSVLHQGVQAIAEVVTVPGEINVDFADVKTILSNAGPAWLAIGRGKGENRAVDAAKMATRQPLAGHCDGRRQTNPLRHHRRLQPLAEGSAGCGPCPGRDVRPGGQHHLRHQSGSPPGGRGKDDHGGGGLPGSAEHPAYARGRVAASAPGHTPGKRR